MLKHVNKKVRFQSLYLQQMINYMDKSTGVAMLSAAQFLCKRRFGTDFYALRGSALSNLTLQLIWNHKITKHLYVWTVGGENPRWHRGSMQTPPHKDLCCPVYSNPGPSSFSEATVLLFLCVKSQIGDNMYYSSVFHRHRFPFIMLSSVCFSADPGSCKDG